MTGPDLPGVAALEQTIAEHQPEDVGANCICGDEYPCEIRLMTEEAVRRLQVALGRRTSRTGP
jgi:hypothetical protein